MNPCWMCGAAATRVCTQCGRFCCEPHTTGGNLIGGRAVCQDCVGKGMALSVWGFLVLAVVFLFALALLSSKSQPTPHTSPAVKGVSTKPGDTPSAHRDPQ